MRCARVRFTVATASTRMIKISLSNLLQSPGQAKHLHGSHDHDQEDGSEESTKGSRSTSQN